MVAQSEQSGPFRFDLAAAEHGDLLAAPAAGGRRPEETQPLEDLGPVRLGPYECVGLIARGGMGVVYRARQSHPIRRDVAIKLLHAGRAAPIARARFDLERCILARLDHPNIARLVADATTDVGEPMLVMEHVPGPDLVRYARQREHGLASRLDLFRDVCAAIAHAHAHGVVHRDIKPANVLVTELFGVPIVKVIDFGVARALDPSLPAIAPDAAGGHLVGTVQYMSPEQLSGRERDVTTAVDVYALGLLLWELLTDRPARPFTSASVTEARQRILEEPVPAPSTVRHARRLRVPRSLDRVCLRALRRDPDERYASVDTMIGALDEVRAPLRRRRFARSA